MDKLLVNLSANTINYIHRVTSLTKSANLLQFAVSINKIAERFCDAGFEDKQFVL